MKKLIVLIPVLALVVLVGCVKKDEVVNEVPGVRTDEVPVVEEAKNTTSDDPMGIEGMLNVPSSEFVSNHSGDKKLRNAMILRSRASWETYTDPRGFSLEYPSDLYTETTTPEEIIIPEGITPPKGIVNHSVAYISSEGASSAENLIILTQYDLDLDQCMSELTENLRPQYPHDAQNPEIYTLEQTQINGAKAYLYKRNFNGNVGNIYHMYLEADDNTCIKLESGDTHNILDEIYQSVKIVG